MTTYAVEIVQEAQRRSVLAGRYVDPAEVVGVSKRARTITISSGGKRRDDSLNPIVAQVKRDLIALVSEHSNRNKRDVSDEPRNDHGEWSADGSNTPERNAAATMAHDLYMPWLKSLPPDQMTALKTWADWNYQVVNGILRNGKPPEQLVIPRSWAAPDQPVTKENIAKAQSCILSLPEAIESAPPLPNDTTVYRSFDANQFGHVQPGDVVTDRGFVSTALAPDMAAVAGAQPSSVGHADITLPAGTKAAWCDPDWNSTMELVLPPNSSFRVDKVDGPYWNMTYLGASVSKAATARQVGQGAERYSWAAGDLAVTPSSKVLKYSEDQPRDESGRWAGGLSSDPDVKISYDGPHMNVDRNGERIGHVELGQSTENVGGRLVAVPNHYDVRSIAVTPGEKGSGLATAMLVHLHEKLPNSVFEHGSFSSPAGARFGKHMSETYPEWNRMWLNVSPTATQYWNPGDPILSTSGTFSPMDGSVPRDVTSGRRYGKAMDAELLKLSAPDGSLARAYKRDVSDEPRDDHGQWTADGGADMAAPGDWALHSIKPNGDVDFDAAMKGYSAAHYGTDIRGMKGCKPDEGLEALSKLGSLQTQFPGVKVASIGMTDGQWGTGRIAQTLPGYGRASEIQLNPEYWTKGPLDLRPVYGPDNGFHPNATSNPAGYMTHEFGHAVQSYFENANIDPDEHQKYLDWYQNDFKPSSPVSGYAKVDEGEKFAELFSGSMTKGSDVYDTPIAQSMRSMLQSTGVWQPTATKITKRDVSDEARNEHGEWTTDGGGEETAAAAGAVKAAEDKIAYLHGGETVVAIDPITGKEVFTKTQMGHAEGNTYAVDVSDEELAKLNGTVFTHNHPSGWDYASGDPRHNGNSFSRDDLSLAMKGHFAELRAVTPTTIFSMKPGPNGWGDWKTFESAQSLASGDVRSKFTTRVVDGYAPWGDSREDRAAHAEAEHYDAVNELVADNMGWTYTKEPR